MKDLIFVPGLADAQRHPTVLAYEAAYVLAIISKNYQDSVLAGREWDLGVVILGSPAGESLGWAAFAVRHEPPATAKLISFSGDKPLATMWKKPAIFSAEVSTPTLLANDCSNT